MPSSPAGSSRVLLSGKALGASAMISVGATRPCPYRGRGLLVTAPRHGWGRRGVGIIWGQARPVWSSPHRRGLSPHVLGGSGGGGGYPLWRRLRRVYRLAAASGRGTA